MAQGRRGSGAGKSRGRGEPEAKAARRKPARQAARSGGAKARPRTRRSLTGRFMVWTAVAGAWLAVAAVGLVAWYAYTLPDIDRAAGLSRGPSVTLLAANGEFLTSFGDLYGTPVKLEDLPPHLPRAVIAIEDRRFFEHPGIDVMGLGRAMLVNLSSGGIRQGGSTLTQQLAKNLFLTPERTFSRKIQEMLLAFWLERRFTKEQILELYLNRVYLGAGAYGVDAAARRYFGIPATEVDLWQSAVLAGLLKAPSRLAPTQNPDGAATRAHLVLRAMVDAGYLREEDAADPRRVEQPIVPSGSGHAIGARYFADWVMDHVQGYLGYVDRDLMVRTTLDPALQAAAVRAVRGELDRAAVDGGKGPGQAALVAMTPGGEVRAMVGGRNYRESQFNRATQALRQPGSAFKPFVFLAAIEAGWEPGDILVDEPVRVGSWNPRNYRDHYFGEVTLRDAMAYSANSIAVRLTERVGRQRVIEAARRLGVTTNLTGEPSIALGTSEVPLIEMAGAYATFAADGAAVAPHGVLEIRDDRGRVIYQRTPPGRDRVVAPNVLERVNNMLGAVVGWGTGRDAALDRHAAGKTGTTQGHRDAWFVGFTADYVAGVWTGNDSAVPVPGMVGGGIPARVWHRFMTEAHEGRPARTIPGVDGYEQRMPVAAAPGAGATPSSTAPAAASRQQTNDDRESETTAEALRRIFGLSPPDSTEWEDDFRQSFN